MPGADLISLQALPLEVLGFEEGGRRPLSTVRLIGLLPVLSLLSDHIQATYCK